MYTGCMVQAILACLALQSSPPYIANRYDLGVRLEAVDAAWVACTARDRKAAAVPMISKSVMAFFSGKNSDAAQALDQAWAALLGRKPRPEDAVTATVWPPVAASGDEVEIRFRLCYSPQGAPPEVEVGSYRAKFGDKRSISVPWVVPDGPTGPVKVGIKLNDARREVIAYRDPGFLQSLEKLLTSQDPNVLAIADGLKESLEGRGETSVDLLDQLSWAQSLDSKKHKLADREEAKFARFGATRLRAWVPKGAKDGIITVVALHGAGGSENLFFQGYGAGAAVKEAKSRGWAFLSPRSGPKAAQDALDWLRSRRGVQPGAVFVMGHSMGGGLALQTGSLNPKPTAIAALAPAANQIPSSLDGVPVYVAVGAQEIGMLQNMVNRIEQQMKDRPKSKVDRFDPCEHLMIVAEAAPAAFRFFDECLRGGG